MKPLSNVKTRPFHAHTHWAQDPPTRIVLLRHGETAWNVARRIQGWTGTSLNATGILQAKVAAARLKRRWKFDAIVSSDIRRALQTARLVAKGYNMRVRSLKGARERRFGEWEGKSIDQVLDKYKLGKSQKRDPFLSFDPRGGESMAKFTKRVRGLLEQIEKEYAGKTVLLVTHGGPMRIAACVAAGIPWKRYFLLGRPGNAALSLIESQGGVRWVEFYNDTAHLERRR